MLLELRLISLRFHSHQPPLVCFFLLESQVSEGETASKAPTYPCFLADLMGNAPKGHSSVVPCAPARHAQDKALVGRVTARGRIGAVGFLQFSAMYDETSPKNNSQPLPAAALEEKSSCRKSKILNLTLTASLPALPEPSPLFNNPQEDHHVSSAGQVKSNTVFWQEGTGTEPQLSHLRC